jgi:hypothetical protein
MCTERIAGRRDAFDLLDQARDVVGVEPDGASEMDCAQLAALDEPLHCSWMNVERSAASFVVKRAALSAARAEMMWR